jgi:uncharacterized membrane protein required for colicin V production
MPIFLDVLLVVLFAFIAFWGCRKGFFKSILQFGRLALTILLTIALGSEFSSWLDEKFIHQIVYNKVHTKLAEMAASADANAFFSGVRNTYGALATVHGPVESVGGSLDSAVEQYSTSISTSLSRMVSVVVGYILLFLILFLVLTVVIWILSKLVKLPVLKQCDKLLGLLLGLVNGFLIISLLATLLYGLLYITNNLSVYESSYVLRFMYDLHIFQFILDIAICD